MHNTQVQEFASAVGKGASIIVADPRYSVAASKAKFYLPLKPGTDLALLLAWMNIIVGEKLSDRDYLDKYGFGFPQFAADPYRGSHATIDTRDLAIQVSRGAELIRAPQLADWIIQDRSDFRLIDLRGEKDFAAYHIPTAQNFSLASLGPDVAARNEKILLCSEDGLEASNAWFLLHAQEY